MLPICPMFENSKGKIQILTMRDSTLNAKHTLFWGAPKACWSSLYMGEEMDHEVTLPDVGLQQGVGMNCIQQTF